MAGASRIFIDDEYGSLTRTEFRRLRKAEKLERIEAWFRERYQTADMAAVPWVEGEYLFLGNRPNDPYDVIQDEFGDFVPYEVMEGVIADLRREHTQWILRREYGEDFDDEPREGTEPEEIGGPEEVAFRREIVRKLDEIETLIANRPKPSALLGHNQPPEALADDDNALLDGLADTVRNLKSQLSEPKPEVATVVAHLDTANGITQRIRDAMARKLDLATDEFAKEIGKQAAKLPFWYGVWVALHQVLGWVGHWLNMIGWGG